ncbi:MAG: hypothetical protein H6739_29345 [Alphaproteobacteria bacterium]|nr:hypothetical protein [Alphaproteobacteria bacterium]
MPTHKQISAAIPADLARKVKILRIRAKRSNADIVTEALRLYLAHLADAAATP